MQPPLSVLHLTCADVYASAAHGVDCAVQDEDADVPVLALVDLYGSQPMASAAAAGVSSTSSRYPGAKLRMAGLFYVHKGLYDERPGMRLLQVRVPFGGVVLGFLQ